MTDRIADLDGVDDALDGREGDGAAHAGQREGTSEPVDVPAATAERRPGPRSPARAWESWRRHRRNRVSKWDRPPAPKDWRYFVGTLGKVLIATGILMFGFVGYQLWGTGIETARAQNRLENAFEEVIAERGARTSPDPTDPVETDPVETDAEPDAGTDVEEGDGSAGAEPDDGPLPELPDPVPSQVVPGGVDLSDVAVEQDVPPIDRGDVVARLQIPKIDKDLYVVAGVSLEDLKNGPGHYPDTPLPGQLGNAAIAGHRTTYGAPFFDVDQLAAGDELIVTTITGDRFVYEVTGVQVVSASDYWVVTTRDPGVAELTLTSCHPKYTARDRIVVHSVLVPERSANVGVAELYEVDGRDEPIPGDDPTLAEPEQPIVATIDDDAGIDLTARDDAAEPTVDETTVEPATSMGEPAASTGAPGESPDASVGDGEVPVAPEPGTVDDPGEVDAFSQGWFDDDDAWPQIAVWGLALTVISLLAYQVSRRTRHDSIGFLVGIGPFLFCLYFFFQNVNRLLPPGL